MADMAVSDRLVIVIRSRGALSPKATSTRKPHTASVLLGRVVVSAASADPTVSDVADSVDAAARVVAGCSSTELVAVFGAATSASDDEQPNKMTVNARQVAHLIVEYAVVGVVTMSSNRVVR